MTFILGEDHIGYLWIFPKADYHSVGIGALRPKPGELQATLARVIGREEVFCDLATHHLRRAARRAEDFARPITLEMGKLIEESRGEVALRAGILDYYAENAERFLAPQQLAPASGEATIESSPLGVLFGVEPWNFHYYQLARFVAPNLRAGKVVLVKQASNVPQCAIAFADLFIEAGAYTNLLISKAQVAAVIADPRIKGVALTGSEAAGAIVAGQAGLALRTYL